MRKQVSVEEAQRCLSDIVRAVAPGAAVELVADGKPLAMIVSMEEYERWAAGAAVNRSGGEGEDAQRDSSRTPNIFEHLDEWRREHDIEALDITPDIFPGPREPWVIREPDA